MTRGEVIDAVNALNARKEAMGLGFAADGEGGLSGDYPGLTVGMDLDMREVTFVGRQLAAQTEQFLEKSGEDLLAVLSGVWVDGLLAGLLLAERRARGEAAAA